MRPALEVWQQATDALRLHGATCLVVRKRVRVDRGEEKRKREGRRRKGEKERSG